MRRYALLAAVGLAAGIGIPLSYGGMDAFDHMGRVSAWLLLAVLGMVVLGWNFNALRLSLLLGGLGRPLTHKQALATVMATEFAICATPASAGGPLTLIYLLRRYGVRSSQAAAVYAMAQLMDLLFFISMTLVIAAMLLFSGDMQHVLWQVGILGTLLSAGLGMLWLLVHNYSDVLRVSGRWLQRLRVSHSKRRALARWLLQFRSGLALLLKLSQARLAAVYAFCVGHWLLRYSVLYVLIQGVGYYVEWSYVFIAQMLALSLGQVTMLPGGTGGVELGMSALLSPVLPASALAAVLLLWRFATYYWYLLAGGPVFGALAGRALWHRLTTLLQRRRQESVAG